MINDEVAGTPVVVLSREGTLSALDRDQIKSSRLIPSATAWKRNLHGRTLSFELRDARIVDRETGSQWTVLGTATAGPLAGKRLEIAPSGIHFAFAWLSFNPESSIYGR